MEHNNTNIANCIQHSETLVHELCLSEATQVIYEQAQWAMGYQANVQMYSNENVGFRLGVPYPRQFGGFVRSCSCSEPVKFVIKSFLSCKLTAALRYREENVSVSIV